MTCEQYLHIILLLLMLLVLLLLLLKSDLCNFAIEEVRIKQVALRTTQFP